MSNVIKIISKVPDDLFIEAKAEVSNIDWNNLPVPDKRSEASVFKTSITNHIRVHDVTKDTPHTIEALSAIVECRDTPARKLYPNLDNLVDTFFQIENGLQIEINKN